MKLLNYTLAGVIGAAMATLVMPRVFDRTAVEPTTAAPVAVRPRMVAGQSPADFARLTKEKAELDAQLAEARSKLVEHEATLVQTKASLEELRRPMMTDMMSSALRAELKSGEVVVTGGYKLSNGKRLYAFAQPVIEQVDGKDVVKIESRFISLTDEEGKSVGLDSIATNATNTLQHGEVWVADEQTSVLAKLNASPDADLLTSPSIMVRPGSSGAIELGDLKLKVTPVISADHTKMDFEVRLEQPQALLTPPPEEPLKSEAQAQAGAKAAVEGK
ncbi:MAG: hypothetical protein WC661_21675 [Opitutaceae bacterium]